MPPFFSEVKDISEDCLNLRVSRPAELGITSASKLPIVVWLYRGGVVKGSSTDEHFDPTGMLKLSVSAGKPIIYAALNYRLSIFGFARSETLNATDQ
jgi:carboxylesterase type B